MAEQGPSAADAKQALNMLETMKSKLGGVLQQIGGAKRKLKKRRKSRRKSHKKSHKCYNIATHTCLRTPQTHIHKPTTANHPDPPRHPWGI